MGNLVDHLEKELGEIVCGWTTLEGETDWKFQIVKMTGGTIRDCISYSTLGLSKFEVPSVVSQKMIRQELLIMTRPSFEENDFLSVLYNLGHEAIDNNAAWLAGDVVGPRSGVLIEGTSFEALYIAPPVYFPDSFAVYTFPGGEEAVIAWLIPIYLKEAEFIQQQGWPAFEDLLEAKDPDLLDFSRPSVV